MTLTLETLAEFRRAEKETAEITRPPVNFLPDLKDYLTRVQEEARQPPAMWDPDCEAHAAMDILEDIFRIRRGKLARAAELNPDNATLPSPGNLFEFESCCWFGLTGNYRLLGKVYKDLCIRGEWSGKWGKLTEEKDNEVIHIGGLAANAEEKRIMGGLLADLLKPREK